MNSNLATLKSDQNVLQDLYTRINALEQKPDIKDQIMANYATNFKIIKQQYDDIYVEQKHMTDVVSGWCASVKKAVKSIDIVFDERTLKDLNVFLQQQLGMDLRAYVTSVQKQSIHAEFKPLVDSMDELLEKQQNGLKELKLYRNYQEQVNSQVGFYFHLVMLIMIMGVIMALPLYISAIANHPIWSILILILGAGLGYWQYKESDAKAEEFKGDDKNED